MNKPLLRKVRDMIKRRPRQFVMSWWYDTVNQTGGEPSHCGTAACIGGWTVILGRNLKNPAALPLSRYAANHDISGEARRLLKITHEQASDLFGTWPNPFGDQFSKAKRQQTAVNIAVRRINHFLKTGK